MDNYGKGKQTAAPCILSGSGRREHGGKGVVIWVHKGARFVSLMLSSMPGNGTTEAGVPR